MRHSTAASVYLSACNREHAECALELIGAFNANGTEVVLSERARPLSDVDVVCVAEALRVSHSLRMINLEENSFGLLGVQALCDALMSNPGHVRELRLGRNKLTDPAATSLGNALASGSLGLKVLDLSENTISKAGVTSLAAALDVKTCALSTLDLTSNRIGPQGGQELCRALLHPTCTLQRLNLRHN